MDYLVVGVKNRGSKKTDLRGSASERVSKGSGGISPREALE